MECDTVQATNELARRLDREAYAKSNGSPQLIAAQIATKARQSLATFARVHHLSRAKAAKRMRREQDHAKVVGWTEAWFAAMAADRQIKMRFAR